MLPQPKADPSAKTRRAQRKYEQGLQISLVREFRMVVDDEEAEIWAIPNGELRSAATAGLLKAMGVRPAVMDLEINTNTGRCVRVELKLGKTVWHEKTYLSKEQRDLCEKLRRWGHEVYVVRNADEFWAVVEHIGIKTRGVPRIQHRLTGLGPSNRGPIRAEDLLE